MTRSEYRHYSGFFIVKILEKHFQCSQISIKGSHLKLKRKNKTIIVPLHSTVAYGTFKSILSQSDISEEQFYSVL